jgi:DNA repair protein RecN (Recombination protein N)
MLKSLYISNYALIESLEINFPDGLIIITGETGAGKSILLGALSLLLGAKAETSVFKKQDKNCVVEAEFIVEHKKSIEELFEKEQIEFDQLRIFDHKN